MSQINILDWIERHEPKLRGAALGLIIILVLGSYVLVNITGGTKYAYLHSMYIPVLLAGLFFGIRGGMLVGIVAGLMLGPLTPTDVLTGETQHLTSWLFRLGVFVLIGGFSGMGRDAALSYQKKLKWLLQHNSATRLPNRSALISHIAALEASQSVPHCYLLAVICCENDIELKSAFGSQVTEQVILQLARRFKQFYPDVGVYHTETAQIGLLIRIENQKLDPLLAVLQKNSHEPIVYNDLKIHIDSRMGYVVFSQLYETPQAYLHMAEAALVAAHEKSREQMAYSSAIKMATEENIQLLGELKHAIEAGQLTLHYQPKINIKKGMVYGVEALLRWEHPIHGCIAPGKFIPRAEQSTLIDLITEFVLEQSVKQLSLWQSAGINLSISVNISSRNLLKPGFTDYVLQLLNQHDLCGDLLELEITEGSLIVDVKHTIEELNRLTRLKVIISIDDFGTGYSSLQYLHQLPISVLKLDQSFVRRLPQDRGAGYILQAAITLAHNLNITAIAEGVENQEVYEFLTHIDCDMVQGFYICPPIEAQAFTLWYQACQGKYPAPQHSV